MTKIFEICKPLLLIAMLIALVVFGLGSEVTIRSPEHASVHATASKSNVVASASVGFETAESIKVMTFNIRHGRGMDENVDLDRIVEIIRESGAEIVALQEVDRFKPRSRFVDQAGYIADQLQMSWSFAPSFSVAVTQYGNALLSRYPIVSAERVILGGNREGRNMLLTNVDWNGRMITIASTHLGVYESERKHQMETVLEALEQLGDIDRAAMFIGDFNMTKEHELLRSLDKAWHSPSVQAPTASGKEIDHIYMNASFESVQAYTIPTLASDHHPVVVEMRWKSP